MTVYRCCSPGHPWEKDQRTFLVIWTQILLLNIKDERNLGSSRPCLYFIDKGTEAQRIRDLLKVTHLVRSRGGTGLAMRKGRQIAIAAS